MTGWRCGWTIAPKELTSAFNTIQGQTTSNITSITQKAALAAVSGAQDSVVVMLNEYRQRRDSIHQWLTANPGIRCVMPGGAFYLFPDISGLLSPDGLKTSAESAQALLEKEFVVVTPGEGFDAPGDLRISYATSMEQLREGATRILRFAESLAHHKGGILNVASVASFVPGPGMAVYHATKAYILSFSQALHRELAPRGIRVTALCPGPVETEFQARAGIPQGYFPRLLARSAERVAREGYDGLMRGRRVVVPGSDNKVAALLPRLLPRGLMLKMVSAFVRRHQS